MSSSLWFVSKFFFNYDLTSYSMESINLVFSCFCMMWVRLSNLWFLIRKVSYKSTALCAYRRARFIMFHFRLLLFSRIRPDWIVLTVSELLHVAVVERDVYILNGRQNHGSYLDRVIFLHTRCLLQDVYFFFGLDTARKAFKHGLRQ